MSKLLSTCSNDLGHGDVVTLCRDMRHDLEGESKAEEGTEQTW